MDDEALEALEEELDAQVREGATKPLSTGVDQINSLIDQLEEHRRKDQRVETLRFAYNGLIRALEAHCERLKGVERTVRSTVNTATSIQQLIDQQRRDDEDEEVVSG